MLAHPNWATLWCFKNINRSTYFGRYVNYSALKSLIFSAVATVPLPKGYVAIINNGLLDGWFTGMISDITNIPEWLMRLVSCSILFEHFTPNAPYSSILNVTLSFISSQDVTVVSPLKWLIATFICCASWDFQGDLLAKSSTTDFISCLCRALRIDGDLHGGGQDEAVHWKDQCPVYLQHGTTIYGWSCTEDLKSLQAQKQQEIVICTVTLRFSIDNLTNQGYGFNSQNVLSKVKLWKRIFDSCGNSSNWSWALETGCWTATIR